jgi:hypothetical protein
MANGLDRVPRCCNTLSGIAAGEKPLRRYISGNSTQQPDFINSPTCDTRVYAPADPIMMPKSKISPEKKYPRPNKIFFLITGFAGPVLV